MSTPLLGADMGDRSMPLIINCAPEAQKGAFFEAHTENSLKWMHVSASDPLNTPIFSRHSHLLRISASHRAARAAKDLGAAIVITHGPQLSFLVQHFLNLYGYRGRHLAFTFNYPRLPTGLKGVAHRIGFKGIDKFVVFSNAERRTYHEYFDIPLDRIEFMHWGVGLPRLDPADQPLVSGQYVCALGGNSRDYRTFIESLRRLPEVNAVMIVRPENLVGLDLPPNVRAMTNIPLAQAMNILSFSRFMALPLDGADVPCGHVTLVNAMHLGKAFAITRSAGIADYIREGENALMFSAKSVNEMTDVLHRMWYDPDLCAQLGAAGRAFAAEHCTEGTTFTALMRIFRQLGVQLSDASDAGSEAGKSEGAGLATRLATTYLTT
jgi:glycosyltransferase involved in cell wall biosynthesis